MKNSHHQLNQIQYQGKAQTYMQSQVHAEGIEFAKMRQIINATNAKTLLDLGCGGGHVSYQLADLVDSVIAYDLSEEMVTTVCQTAKTKGLNNITGKVGCAEKLPFADRQFDVVITRFSAHHWQHISQAIAEMYRVVKPNDVVIVVDILGHSQPVINNFLQTIETLRDPSHVRDYSLAEWLYFVEMANFCVKTVEKQRLTLDFDSWIDRMKPQPSAIDSIRHLQTIVADNVKNYFDI